MITIKANAFSECYSLMNTGLSGNNTIKTIGESCFEGCHALTDTGLNTNTGISEIPNKAFYNCFALTNTGLSGNQKITKIGEEAFSYCPSLEKTGLETNRSVKKIGSGAFSACYQLTDIIVSKNSKVEEMGGRVFAGASNLNAYVITGENIPQFSIDTFGGTGCIVYYPTNIINGTITNVEEGSQYTNTNSIPEKAKVTIQAEQLLGKRFKQWKVVAGNVVLDNIKNEVATFTMSNKYVKVIVEYEDINYRVSVTDGKTDKTEYHYQDVVSISADTAPLGKQFKQWEVISGDVVFNDKTKASTTFVMPNENVEVKAVYEDIPKVLISNINVYSQNGVDHVVEKGKLQMCVKITPTNADNKEVIYSTSDSSIAVIGENGLLTAKKAGKVIVSAKAKDGSDVVGVKEITITSATLPDDKQNKDHSDTNKQESIQSVSTKDTTDKTRDWSMVVLSGLLMSILLRKELKQNK
ncbi:MAG: hypothetical protein EOM50_04825 [Erysipelotrichia bacterium]|nr:hypothetical protein [Erysipelotrichia bacterium]